MKYSRIRSIAPLQIMALIFTMLAFTACTDHHQASPEEHIALAKDYQDEEKLNEAAIELKNALQKAPDKTEARWLLGLIYLEMGRGNEAEGHLKRAMEQGIQENAIALPMTNALLLQKKYQEIVDMTTNVMHFTGDDHAELWAIRGHALLALGNIQDADTAYNSALTLDPHSAEAHIGKARLALTRGQTNMARSLVEELLRKEPESAAGWSLLGDLEGYEGNAEAAESAYNKAISLRYSNSDDLLKRALVRIHMKSYDSAATDIKELQNRYPGGAGVAYAKGMLSFYQQDYANAQLSYEQALSSKKNFMPAVFYLGVSHYAQKHMEQASVYLTKYLRQDPQSDAASKLLASVYIHLGDYDEAASLLETSLARNPNDILTLKLLSSAAVAQGDMKAGIEYMQRIVSLQPDSPGAQTTLGLSLLTSGAGQLGEHALQTAIELDQGLNTANIILIAHHIDMREFEKAMAMAHELQAKDPEGVVGLKIIGVIHLAEGETDDARKVFEQILERIPGEPSTTFNLAGLELGEGNVERARSLILASLKSHPGHVRLLLKLAELENQQGDSGSALGWLKQALEANPDNPLVQVRLARHYLNIGQPRSALMVVEKIDNKQLGVHPGLLSVAGDAMIATGDPSRAIKTFQQLVQLQPRSAQAHFKLARALIAANEIPAAQQELAVSLRLDPAHVRAKLVLSRLQMLEGDAEEANRLLLEVKQRMPENPTVLKHEGWLASRQNRPQDALAAYKAAHTLAPDSESISALAFIQWQTSDRSGALTTLEQWLKENPGDLLNHAQLANYYLLLGDSEQAISSYKDILKVAPDSVIALNNLTMLLRTEDRPLALRYAKRAYELAPESPTVMDTLGLVLLDEGDTQRALYLFRSASSMAPDNPSFHYHLALVLNQSGDIAGAREILTELLEAEQPFQEKSQAQALLNSVSNDQ